MILPAMEIVKTSEDYRMTRTIATCCYSGEIKKGIIMHIMLSVNWTQPPFGEITLTTVFTAA